MKNNQVYSCVSCLTAHAIIYYDHVLCIRRNIIIGLMIILLLMCGTLILGVFALNSDADVLSWIFALLIIILVCMYAQCLAAKYIHTYVRMYLRISHTYTLYYKINYH